MPEPTDDDVPYETLEDARSRRFLFEAIPVMRKVIAAGDTSSEPVELMDPEYVAARCADMIEEDPAAPLPEHCNDPAIREAADTFVARRRGSNDEDEMAQELGDSAAAIANSAEAAVEGD